MHRISAPVTIGETRSRDGTRLTYYTSGKGPRRWLMPPAMGAPLASMKYILEHFQNDFTIVSWDMRGFYKSDAPANDDALRVQDHVDDLEAVRAAAGFDRYVLGGWSMGVQVSLESYGQAPERVEALVLINGPYEHPLATALPIPRADRVTLPLARLGTRIGRGVGRVSRSVLARPGMGKVLHRLGVVAQNPEYFEEVLRDFSTIDWSRYFRLMKLLHEHSAARHLPHIRVPTLITAGTRDFMTPVSLARAMHEAIPGSQLQVIEGGTHYTVVEFPAELNAAIQAFFLRTQAAAAIR